MLKILGAYKQPARGGFDAGTIKALREAIARDGAVVVEGMTARQIGQSLRRAGAHDLVARTDKSGTVFVTSR
jgi:hypothetical protein